MTPNSVSSEPGAGQDDDVSPATRAKIVELYGPAFVKAATDSCREALFKYMPRTLDDVVTDVVARVDVASVQAVA